MKIGIDLGGSHIGIGLINEKYEIVDKVEKDWTKEEKENLWTIIPQLIEKFINQILTKNNIAHVKSIGIGFPASKIISGIIYKKEMTIDLISALEPVFKTKVYVKNDVKCSGMCEKRIGNLKEYNNALFLTLGTGIGGAYFYKNELVVPNQYPGLEIGSMIINKDGKLCKCGKRGCFEAYAAMGVFREKVANLFQIEKVTSDIVYKLIEKQEKKQEMNEIIEEYVNDLALGLSNLISILEPDAIGIGGSFVYYESIFMNRLNEKLEKAFPNRNIPKLVTAKFGNDAGIIGASMLENN